MRRKTSWTDRICFTNHVSTLSRAFWGCFTRCGSGSVKDFLQLLRDKQSYSLILQRRSSSYINLWLSVRFHQGSRTLIISTQRLTATCKKRNEHDLGLFSQVKLSKEVDEELLLSFISFLLLLAPSKKKKWLWQLVFNVSTISRL